MVKKVPFFLVAVVLLILCSGALFGEESEYFVKTVPVSKVYSHILGYRVLYLKSDLNFGEFYVPIKWFTEAGSKGELIWGAGPEFPFFSIFYKNGEFYHIRLYLKRNLNDRTWGILRHKPGMEERFNIETLDLEF